MVKKTTLAPYAKELYVEKFMSIDAIAKQVGVNERTIRRWKNAEKWDCERAEHLKLKTTFHEDLYKFSHTLFNSIKQDMEEGKKVEPARLYMSAKLTKMIGLIKKYEDDVAKSKANKTKEPTKRLTPEIIQEIEENILGIKLSLIHI